MRNSLIAKIHIAKNQLGMNDDEYRDLLERLTEGKRSCADCNETELDLIMQNMIKLGFKQQTKKKLSPITRHKEEKEQIDKIRALWIDMARRGVIGNRYEPALQKFCHRITKVSRLEWLSIAQCSAVIAALNEMDRQHSAHQSVDTDLGAT